MYTDTHVHLDFEDFHSDRDLVVARALKAGVTQMITIGTNWASSLRAVAIAQDFHGVFAAIGVHPHEAKDMTEGIYASLRGLARNPLVVAMGEIGLDFYKEYSPRREQIMCFKQQMCLARELELPLIIHDREAHKEILEVMEEENAQEIGGVFHCFSGDKAFARKCLDMGFYISFTGIITFPKATTLQDVVGYVPLDRLLIETDAPFLSPVPYRGKRNEPSYLTHVAQKIAELKKIPVSEVAKCTKENAKALFRLQNP